MKHRVEDLLVEVARFDAMNRVCAESADHLAIAVEEAIQTVENTMFDMYARSMEKTAQQVQKALVGLKSIREDVKHMSECTNSASTWSRQVFMMVLLGNTDSMSDKEIDDLINSYKKSFSMAERTAVQLKAQIMQTQEISVSMQFLKHF